MDHTSPLELGDSARRQVDLLPARCLGFVPECGQLPFDVDARASPHLRRTGVLQDGTFVVVAVGTQRRAHQGVGQPVITVAVNAPTMLASSRCGNVPSARQRPVYCTETGCSQRQEDGGMGHDRLVHSLAPDEARPYQVSSVVPVDGSTRGAASLPTVATGFEHGVCCRSGVDTQPVASVLATPLLELHRSTAPTAATPSSQEVLQRPALSVADERFDDLAIPGVHDSISMNRAANFSQAKVLVRGGI
jgi:hypothetical protein